MLFGRFSKFQKIEYSLGVLHAQTPSMKIPQEILAVATHLDDLREEVVFVGGMVRPPGDRSSGSRRATDEVSARICRRTRPSVVTCFGEQGPTTANPECAPQNDPYTILDCIPVGFLASRAFSRAQPVGCASRQAPRTRCCPLLVSRIRTPRMLRSPETYPCTLRATVSAIGKKRAARDPFKRRPRFHDPFHTAASATNPADLPASSSAMRRRWAALAKSKSCAALPPRLVIGSFP
jgi:hypothetical protein